MTKVRSPRVLALAVAFLSMAGLAGCNGNSQDNNPSVAPGHADGVTLAPGTPNNATGASGSGASGSSLPSDANTMTVAVKYVALKNTASDAASPTQDEVNALLLNMSTVWSQCDIHFVLEEYDTPVASADGLLYYPANQSDLEAMRSKYFDGKHALYVKTGLWNRSGDLGADGSNGFSTLPPSNPEGTVLEDWVSTNTLLVSHETGHLIGGLDHTTDTTNLMNHFVTTSTTQLTPTQCSDARQAMTQYHQAWIR